MQGYGPYNITKLLEKEKIDILAYHQQKLGIGLYQTLTLKLKNNIETKKSICI